MGPRHVSPDVRLSELERRPRFGTPPSLKARLPDNGASACGIPIVVVADPPVVCHGLGALVDAQPDFRVVGEASDGAAALRLTRELSPAVLLLDFPLAGPSRPDLIRECAPSCRLVVITDAIENTEVVALLRAGARGIVSKDSPVELIFKCLRKVHAGEVWIGRQMAACLVEALAGSRAEQERSPICDFRLTPREREILHLVLEAETNRRIAQRLSVTEDTVKHHLTNIFDKTGASNRLELALFALHHGLNIEARKAS